MKLPAFFSDGMVLSKTANIWGWASPGQAVCIQFLGKSYNVTANEDGRFDAVLQSPEFGGPHTLQVGEITIKDVYIGRVWFCSGQSNMEGPILRARMLLPQHIVDDPRIRMFQVEKGHDFDAPRTDVAGKWHTAEGEIMDSLFALPYFFARQLLTDDPTPIGLLCNPAGGTPVQGWLPESIVEEFPEYHKLLMDTVKKPGFMEKVMEDGNQRVGAWHKELAEKDRGLQENWQCPKYDDAAWATRMLLNPAGLPQHGAIWLRKRINLPKISGKATLKLGRAENSVKVYVNGQQVISVDYMYPPCTCDLPEGVLKEGENLIAIRLVGDGGNPKFIPGKEYALKFDGQAIPLDGQWKWQVGTEMPRAMGGGWFYGFPCGLYNYMLAPILGYSADGMLWYQGESNVGNPASYKALFTRYVQHVRETYGPDFPVIFNQLANYTDPNGNWEGWPKLREQQRQCLEIPNTAMSVSIDCGEWNDLHPLDKKTVGERMALHARRLKYGEDIISDGPIVQKAEITDSKLVISFQHGEGLWADKSYPIIDIVSTEGEVDRMYAMVRGETLVVDLKDYKKKAEIVRFGWLDSPAVAVYNAYNLPASPFEVRL
ncbi:MAG: sialate O-acetylesterase [Defluviitaleaceae bacterium]|nr:sialate O-acetylesterase [Defluviitaleaceae bacterium]